MTPTPDQLQELYLIGHELTAQLKCYIRLIELLPSGELCIVTQPRELPNQRMIIYVNPNGGRRYV